MQQIDEWLNGLGLGRYTKVFIENGIEFDVLPDLSDQDLERMGVLLGHRRKLLRAAKGLVGAVQAMPAAQDGSDVEQSAERRQLTVMFGDLVGSTALSTRFDPEDLRRVFRAYRDACMRVVARYDGHLAQFMGDGVMVYFGYPRAHEDDAERAVRAGLEIVAAVGWLRTPANERIEVRVGIATGLVVAGDLSTQGQAAVGETPNLAARLQAAAKPGTVVVAASTRRLLGELFRLRPLGGLTAKGIAEPVEAWIVEGETTSESRFEMVRGQRVTRFIGRAAEVALLEERRQKAWRGQGQIVHIVGEAGIGKSRFVSQFAERLLDQPHTRLGCQCSPYHTTSAFYPIIEHLKRAAGLNPGDPLDRQLDKLDTMVSQATARVNEVAPLFAALLSLPAESRYRSSGMSAGERRQRTLTAVIEQLEGLAGKQPVLVLFEDAHWADPSTLEVLDLIADRVRDLPILVLVTSRPEFAPRWASLAHAATLNLGRLDQTEVGAIISQISAGKALPDEVAAQIVAKADGVPLFAEELTKTVLESGLLTEEPGRYRLDRPLPPLAIPTTLQDSLTARLDRLAPVKEIVAIGALIGREFSRAVLESVADRDPATLDAALDQLEEAELLFRTHGSPDVRYRFKHALVQDAAYEGLLKSRRQVLHRRIAEVLCEKFPAIAGAEPELIAHHYTQSGLLQSAIDWWRKAGEQAAARSAYVEASSHYEQAIALADTLPADPARRQERLKLQIAYAQTLSAVRTPGAPETAAAFARARELAEEVHDSTERLSLSYGHWASCFVRGELAAARALAATITDSTDSQPNSPRASVAHRVLGMTACIEGNLVESRTHLEQSVAAYRQSQRDDLHLVYGHDAGVAAMGNLALVLWQTGEVRRACALADDVIRITREGRHIPTMLYGYFYKSLFEAQRYDATRVAPSAGALFDLCREHFPRSGWLAGASFMLAWSRLVTARDAAGLTDMRRSIAFFREQGLLTYPTLYRAILARTEIRAGDPRAALATLEETIADADRTGLQWWRPELLRLRAEALWQQDPSRMDEAAVVLEAALQHARDQSARSLELRAALSLARLYRATGRAEMSRALLQPVLCAWRDEQAPPEAEKARRLLAL